MRRLREWWAEVQPVVSSLPWTLGLLWQSHRGATVMACALTLVQGLIPVAQLWATKLLIDQVVLVLATPTGAASAADTQRVFLYVGLEAGVILLALLIGTIAGHTFNVLGEHLTYHLQTNILQKCADLDLAYYESTDYYDQLQRAQEQAEHGPMLLLRRLLELSQALVSLLSVAALIFFYRPWLTIVLLLTTIPGFLTVMHYGRQRFYIYNHRTPDGRRVAYLSNILSTDEYAKELRTWGITDYVMTEIRSLRQRFVRENLSLSQKQSVAGLGSEALASIGYYGAYLVVILGVLARQLTLGDLTLYAGAFSRAQSLFDSLLSSLANAYETQLYVQNLAHFLALEPQITAPAQPTPPPPIKQGLTLESLSFTYPETESQVLDGLAFTVRPGECVAIVGANGAGKTTLVKLLLRLYDPDAGRILLDGVDIRDMEPTRLRQQIAVVFQDYARYHLTARENIGFGRVEALHDLPAIQRAAEQARIDEIFRELPDGYDTTLGRRFEGGHELSLGQWQRVAVARALLRNAPILIMDEPTAAMDPQAEYDLYEQLKELSHDRITLLISHRLSTVRMADRILVLEEGRVIEEGTHEKLLASDTRYAYLFRLQAENYQLPPAALDTADPLGAPAPDGERVPESPHR